MQVRSAGTARGYSRPKFPMSVTTGSRCTSLARFSVKVTRDHIGTVQVQMTEPDIYVKLTVLDCEEEVASATGRAQAIVPIFRFLPDGPPKRESAQPLVASDG